MLSSNKFFPVVVSCSHTPSTLNSWYSAIALSSKWIYVSVSVPVSNTSFLTSSSSFLVDTILLFNSWLCKSYSAILLSAFVLYSCNFASVFVLNSFVLLVALVL